MVIKLYFVYSRLKISHCNHHVHHKLPLEAITQTSPVSSTSHSIVYTDRQSDNEKKRISDWNLARFQPIGFVSPFQLFDDFFDRSNRVRLQLLPAWRYFLNQIFGWTIFNECFLKRQENSSNPSRRHRLKTETIWTALLDVAELDTSWRANTVIWVSPDNVRFPSDPINSSSIDKLLRGSWQFLWFYLSLFLVCRMSK